MKDEITVTFTKKEVEIFLDLLDTFGDKLSNAGCNDYSLPNTLENWQFALEVKALGEYDSVEEYMKSDDYSDPARGDRVLMMDWQILNLFENRIKKAVNDQGK